MLNVRVRLACLGLLIGMPTLSLANEAKSDLAFGAPRKVTKPPGFSAGTATRKPASEKTSAGSLERDRKYARDLLTKYDRDGNRVLDKSEWRLISGSPEKADTNRDNKITFDELVARVTKRRREKASASTNEAPDLKSFRIRTAQEKLPEGLPGWFKDRDKNRDGQVAMHEYSRKWTDSLARRFQTLDKNDDGLITPDEATNR